MEKIPLFKGCTEENIYPHDWSNRAKYKNYLANTVMGAHGKILRDFLEHSQDSDLYYNVSSVKVGDILLASCFNPFKKRQWKQYYLVIEKTEEHMNLESFNTYKSAYKYWEKLENENSAS